MSRRKQLKPQALRNDEETGGEIDSSEPLPVVVTDDSDHLDGNPVDSEMKDATSDCSTPPSDLSDACDSEIVGAGNNRESRTFACSFCSSTFSGYTLLKEHEQEHADLMPYRCSLCSKGFKHKRSQDRHQKLHSGVRKYKCTFCETAFFRSDHLKLHMKTHEIANYPYACVICQRGFNSSTSLEAHTQTHNGNGRPSNSFYEANNCLNPELLLSTCSVCNVRFSNPEELMRHLDDEHKASATGGYSMEDCPSAAETTQNHRQLICPFCRKSDFVSVEAFQLHLEALHSADQSTAALSNGSGAYPGACATPDEAEPLTSAAATPSLRITCGLCPETFADVGLLQKHTLRKHSLRDLGGRVAAGNNGVGNNADPTYSCDECGRVFDSILSLHSHATSAHGDESPSSVCSNGGKSMQASASNGCGQSTGASSASPQIYQCGQCDSGLQNLKAFTVHMRQHLDTNKQRDVHCDFCGMMFSNESTRDAHLVGHYLHKESQFSCKSCSKIYSVPEELQKHLVDIHAIHLYRCSLCKEIFESRVDVQVHFAVAHSNEVVRYRCRSCNSAFASEDQFNVHLQVVHLQRALVNGAGGGDTVCRPYYCTLCSKAFPNERDHTMAYHHHGHHSIGVANVAQPFHCPLCGDSFAVEYLYDKHIDTVHRNQMNYFEFAAKSASVMPPPPQQSSVSTTSRVSGGQHSNGFGGGIMPTSASSIIKCNICDEKCDTMVDLAKHKLQHCKVAHSDICNFCQEPIVNVEQFYNHARLHTVPGVPVSCVVCKQSLVSAVEMQAHAKFHLKLATASTSASPIDKACSLCGNTFCNGDPKVCFGKTSSASTPVIQRQSTPLNTGGVVKCTKCSVKFESEDELKSHRALEHCQLVETSDKMATESSVTSAKSYQCMKCQKFFDTESEIRAHVASHVMQDGVAHHCMLCKRVFDSPSKLQRHLIEHSFAGCSEYRCYLCQSIFACAEPLQQHMLVKHSSDERPYECRFCEQKFFFGAELDNHNATQHKPADGNGALDRSAHFSPFATTPISRPVESKPAQSQQIPDAVFVCPQCGLVFNSVTTLKSHSAQCRRKLEANIIGEDYSHRNSSETRSKRSPRFDYKLQASAAVAYGTYPCPHCPKTFNSLSALQGHSHVHMNNSKVHQCHKCKKLFPTAAKLRNHQRQHNGDKPFPCDYCGRYFSRKDNLKVHMRIHYKNGTTSGSPSLTSTTPLSFTDALPTMVPPASDFCLRRALEFGGGTRDDYGNNCGSFDGANSSSGGSNGSPLFGGGDSAARANVSSLGYNLRSHDHSFNDDSDIVHD